MQSRKNKRRRTTGVVFLLGAVVMVGIAWSWSSRQKGQSSSTIPSSSKKTASSSTPPTTPSSSTVKKEQTVDQWMKKMTVEEKVGQLFFARTPEQNQIKDSQTYHLGGYVLFGRDVSSVGADQLKKTIQSYQSANKIPLLIGSDEEGGTVTRISRNKQLVATPFASPQEIYAAKGLEGIVEEVKMKSQLLHEYGIQTGIFPVADVATDPQAFIYDRTLGKDAGETSAYVATVVKTLKEQKIGSTLKHFPGYGNNRDSHVEIVTDTRTIDEFRAQDFLVFHAGIDAGADSVLVNHNIVQAIDATQPASISPAIHDLLRKEFNFNGVIMTDDMDMAGLSQFISQKKAGLKALQAGNDLVMSSSYAIQIPEVLRALQTGEYTNEQLDTSVRRVLEWKEQLGLLTHH